jgi:hypothetical protein
VLGNSEWTNLEWSTFFWELGIAGMRAQGRTNQAATSLGNGLVRTKLRWHDSFRMKHHCHNYGQQYQKNETVPKGYESTIMCIRPGEKGNLAAIPL